MIFPEPATNLSLEVILTTFVVCVAVIGQFKGVGQMVVAVAQQYKTGKGGLVKPHQVPCEFFGV